MLLPSGDGRVRYGFSHDISSQGPRGIAPEPVWDCLETISLLSATDRPCLTIAGLAGPTVLLEHEYEVRQVGASTQRILQGGVCLGPSAPMAFSQSDCG